MNEKVITDICIKALKSFNLQTNDSDYPLNIILKGPQKHLKSFHLVLFLMDIESLTEDLELGVDVFDLVESMGDNITVGELISKLSNAEN